MDIRRYNSGIQEDSLEHPRDIIGSWGEFGFKETIVRFVDNLNERGVRAAGIHYLPLYLLVIFIATAILTVTFRNIGTSIPVIDNSASFILRNVLILLWVATPVVIYWDSAAAERYLLQNLNMGKLNALTGIFLGPAALLLQILYRIRKL